MSCGVLARPRPAPIFGVRLRVNAAGVGRALIAAVCALGLAPKAASAADLTGAERAALAQRVDQFVAAMRNDNAEVMVNIVPPRMLAYIAKLRHISVEALHQSMVEQTNKIEASGIIVSFETDLGKARYQALPDGTPYVLIPTETVLKAPDQKIRKHTNTLAFMENGDWYFVRINTPALVDRLVAVYPHFAGVDFGGETTTVVP